MDSESVSSSSMRARVSTGYGRLDEALMGGFLAGSGVVLSAPASDEVPILLRHFLAAAEETSVLICRTLSSAETALHESTGVRALVCSDKPVPPSKNIIPGKGIDNLTDVNLGINEALSSIQPKRIVLDILSDVLLRHKGLQTRKWLTELLERLRARNITTFAIVNPYMHSSEDVQAVVGLFDGNIEIIEEKVEGTLQKFLRIRWMHGIEVTEKQFALVDLAPQPQLPTQQVPVTAAPLKEPRWLTPLVSRTAELSKLKAAFENATENRSLVVALQGEAGVGKTRLMQELAAYAQSRGAVVLSGSASEDLLPYAPWVEVARQYVAQTPGELLRRMLGTNGSELVKLVPDITATLGTIPPSKTLGDQQDKIRFYEAVTQFFITISRDAPLLLTFDDMQFVDQASLDLFEYFVRSTSNLRILTLCSYPTEELQPNSPLYQTLMKFNKQRVLETVSIKNLSKEETIELIKRNFGEQTISPEFADLIYQRTGGNPFFVEEILRSLVEDGTVFRTEKGWDRKPIQDIVIPESVKAALRFRLTKLDPDALNMVQWAAVVGSDFDFEVLLEASQAKEDALFTVLEQAISQGLLVEVPREKGKFRFADNRIRELLLDELIRVKRARFHHKIGEAMEKSYAKDLESHAEVIATHFSEAGETVRTIKYSIIAGDRNSTIHAYQQAIQNYTLALKLLDEGKEAERAAILEKLAASYTSAGQFQKSVESYEQALVINEKLRDFKSCARIIPPCCTAVLRAKGTRESITMARQGLKYVEGTTESYEAAAIYSRLAYYLAALDEYDEANSWSQRALEAGERSGNFGAVAEALNVMGFYLTDTGRVNEGLPLIERGLEVALQHDQYPQATAALLNLAVYTYPRDLSKARDLASQWLAVAKRENDPYRQATSLVLLSIFDWLGGNWPLALQEIGTSFEIKERIGFTFRTTRAEARRGLLHLGLGDLEEAEKDLQAALAMQDQKITLKVETHLGVGRLRLEQGREDEAKTHFETCVGAFKDAEFTTMPLLHVETLLYLTSLYVKGGQLDEARKMAQWARKLAETLKSDAGLAMAFQSEASVLAAGGDGKRAEEAYLKSLGLWEKAGWPYYKAKALTAYCETIAQTDPEESKKRLREAAESFKKLGAKRDLENVEAKLACSSQID